jgi:hypothetical protein
LLLEVGNMLYIDYLEPSDTYEDYIIQSFTGPTISIPGRTFQLPGGITFSFPGGTWTVGPSGSAQRQAAVAITNAYEQSFQQNLEAYRLGQITQDQALHNFDTIWRNYENDLTQCGPDEKARALADRQRGGRFDWFRAYRDPIAGRTDGVNGPTPIVPQLPRVDLISFVRQYGIWILIFVVLWKLAK